MLKPRQRGGVSFGSTYERPKNPTLTLTPILIAGLLSLSLACRHSRADALVATAACCQYCSNFLTLELGCLDSPPPSQILH